MANFEHFEQWWIDNGKRGISFCECNYKDASLTQIRNWVYQLKGKLPKNRHESNTKSNKTKQKIVQLTDVHIPFEDKKSLELIYRFLKDFKPDQIVLTGDILDFYQLSKFDKDPKRKMTIQDEIDICYGFFKTLKEYCADIHFIKGNHEDRLRRFLWQNPSLASIKALELPKLLNLDLLEIKYHEYQYIYNGFRYTHGSMVRTDSGASAKAELLKYGLNMASGHTHRLGSYVKTDARGTVGAFEMGCLCQTNPEYIDGIPNWQQGFGVFHFEGDRFFCQQVPIIEHKFIYGGKKYE